MEDNLQWQSVTACRGVILDGTSELRLIPTSRTFRLRPCGAAFASDFLVTCFHPIDAWPPALRGGKVVFSPHRSYAGATSFPIPCGRCIGCRIAKARDWATRMTHEAKLHSDNSFITLTYDDRHLPLDGSISREAVQLFLKRLRKAVAGSAASGIRYFAVGEYGERFWRPHYHLITFGFFPPDAKKWRQVRGNITYRSAFLEGVWPYGNVETGRVTPQSCGYVARYSMKKIGGDKAADHYSRPHPVTGQLHRVIPEFALMSRRPGIGAGWFDRYACDAFPSDFLIVDGKKRNVPDYYKRKLDDLPQLLVTHERKKAARTPQALSNKTPERLQTREDLQTLRAVQLKRTLE